MKLEQNKYMNSERFVYVRVDLLTPGCSEVLRGGKMGNSSQKIWVALFPEVCHP